MNLVLLLLVPPFFPDGGTSLFENVLVFRLVNHTTSIDQTLLPHAIGLFLRDVVGEITAHAP